MTTPPSTGPLRSRITIPASLIRRIPSTRQLAFLPQYLSPRERLVIRITGAAIAALLVFWAVWIFITYTHAVPAEGGELTEGLIGTPAHINPVLAAGNDTDVDIARLIFGSLVRYNEHWEIEGDLAVQWELSEDKKTYTFHLRDDARWHDGQPVTANDVVFTIDSIQDPEYKSPLSATLAGVTAVAVDERTLTITLSEPYAPFLTSLTFGILPAHLWVDIPAASAGLAEYNLKPIGSGPYRFDELTKDRNGLVKAYTVVANDEYYERPPYLASITFKFYADSAEASEAARTGRVDAVSYVPKEEKERLATNGDLSFYSLNLPQYTAVFLNQKNKLLADQAVKEGLAFSLDKQSIIDEVLAGEGEVIWAPILPGFVGYHPDIRRREFNPEQAQASLEEAGWKVSEETGLRAKDGQELRFTLTTVDQPEFVATAQALKRAWEEIGIGVEIAIIDRTRIQKYTIEPRDYEALLFGEIVGSDPDPYPFWHSSQGKDPGLNLSVYANKQVDQLLEEARKTDNPEERRLKYLHFQNVLTDELPAIFLYNPTYTWAADEKLKGFTLTRVSVPSDRFRGVTDWYIETDRKWGKE